MSDYVTFRTLMRGYDPEAVDDRIAELITALEHEQRHNAELAARIEQLAAEAAQANEAVQAADAVHVAQAAQFGDVPSFAHLGAIADEMFAMVRAEAERMRTEALDKAESIVGSVEQSAANVRDQADRYAASVRSSAEGESARLIAEAERRAAEITDGADRHAAARHQETEALFERHRAEAATAASDLQATLTARREAAERELQDERTRSEQHLASLREQVGQIEAESATIIGDARKRGEQHVTQAKADAERILQDAHGRAARERQDAEHALAAVTERRDNIHAQLQSLRQMLATFSPEQAAEIVATPQGQAPEAAQGQAAAPAQTTGPDRAPAQQQR